MKKLLFIIAAFLCFAWQAPKASATPDNINGCPAPTELSAKATGISVTFNWKPAGNETQWKLYYKRQRAVTPAFSSEIVTGKPSFTLTDLAASTMYVAYVVAICDDGEAESDPSAQVMISTEEAEIEDCPAPMNINYTDVTSRKATIFWDPAGDEKRWKVGYTTKADLEEGRLHYKSYVVDTPAIVLQLEPLHDYYVEVFSVCAGGNTSSAYGEFTFDTPDDCLIPYDFKATASEDQANFTWKQSDDASLWEFGYKADTETEWSSDTVKEMSMILTNLKFNTKYNARVRSLCMEDKSSNWTEINFKTTNYECLPPVKLGFTDVTTSGATAVWRAANYETEWILQYKASEDEVYSDNINVSDTTAYTLTQLKENTTYNVRMRSACNDDRYSTWVEGSFTTTEETCDAPTNLQVSDVTHHSAVLTWNQTEGTANEWVVNYRVKDTEEWTSQTVTTTTTTIDSLTELTSYEAMVVAHCTNGLNSDNSETVVFTTEKNAVNDYVLNSNINLFPNPTTGVITCNVKDLNVERVEVYDVYGKLLKAFNTNESVIRINASSFANGMYFVRICTEQGNANKTFIKK